MTTFKFRDEFRARQGINTESNLTTVLETNAHSLVMAANSQDWGQILFPKTIQMMKSTERAQGGPTGHVDFI